MGIIFDSLLKFLSVQGWTYQQEDETLDLNFVIEGESGKWMGYARAYEELKCLIVYSIGLELVPEEYREQVALFFTKVNYGKKFGNFEIDLEDGEYRFKTCGDFRATLPTADAVKYIMFTNIAEMDKHFSGIKVLAEGKQSVEQVYELFELDES